MFSTLCHRWSHRAQGVPTNISYPTVLLFHQAWDRSHIPSTKEFSYFSSIPSQNQAAVCAISQAAVSTDTVQSPCDSCCANKECYPPQYFSSTRHETGHICYRPQPSMMQSSYSSLRPLRTGSNLNRYSSEPIGLVLCHQKLPRHSTSLPPAKRLVI